VLSKEAKCLKDTRLEMKASPLECKVSTKCPLLNDCGNIAQFIYKHTVIIFEVRGLLDKYPTFGREKESGLLGALDT